MRFRDSSSDLARIVLLCAAAFASGVGARAAGVIPAMPKGLPVDLWEARVPAGNPVTEEKIALGRRLFFEKRISFDGSVACATCHDPEKGFADGRRVSEGVGRKKGARNSPTLINTAFNEFQFWDGRASSLEEQAKSPMISPDEMGMSDHDAVISVIGRDPTYVAEFQKAFGRVPSIDSAVAAIATFERTVLSGDSNFDRFLSGNPLAMSESAQRGWNLWSGKARCHTCHAFSSVTPNFTDSKFHNIGVAARGRDFAGLARRATAASNPRTLVFDPDFSEIGRYVVTRNPGDLGAFKTPGLRDVALTAPYMHDGSEPTLLSVVEFYDKGGVPNRYLDTLITPLKLTHGERHDLVAFMESLTGQGPGAANRVELRDPSKR